LVIFVEYKLSYSMETRKKTVKTFKEFLSEKKNTQDGNKDKVDWHERKLKWLESIDLLYRWFDDNVSKSLKESGYDVKSSLEKITLYEDYIGSYETENYFIEGGPVSLKLFPAGTLIIGAFGKVNMQINGNTVKLVLEDWGKWKIVDGIGSSMRLRDLSEEHLVKYLD